MPEYLYKIATEGGRVLQEAGVATSVKEMRERLLAQGYYVYSVREKSFLRLPFLEKLFKPARINPDDFVVFNQQFLALNRSGLPLYKSLELLSQQAQNPALGELIADVRQRVQGGALVSEAFESAGMVPPMFIAALRAGERSGNLDETLAQYLSYQKISRTLRKKVASALVYPSLLLVFLIGLVSFVTVFIIPRFAELYAELDVQLPVITQLVIQVSVGLKNAALWILIGLGAGLAFLRWWRNTRGGSLLLDRFKYRLPMIGPVLHKFSVAQFARTLATLLAGGIPVLATLETSRRSAESPLLEAAVATAQSEVRNGRSLADAFRASKFFPEVVTNLVEVGETTGSLVPMLNSAAEFFEEDANVRLARFIALIDPVLIAMLATVVTLVLLAFYLPMLSLVGQVG